MADPCILIVEPDADTRLLYRHCLLVDDVDIVEATDGRDALAKGLAQPPALVITEIRLPFMDGVALCGILRRDHKTARVPILIVTSETRKSELDRARGAGANAVLVKPTTPDAVLTEARRLLADGSYGTTTEAAADSPLPQPPSTKRMPLAKMHQRFATTTPPAPPPLLSCPSCDRPLKYEHSHIGGVSPKHPEQWDYYACPSCGGFQYRQRTRKLRRAS